MFNVRPNVSGPFDFWSKITRNYTYAPHPKIGVPDLIYAKNDAKEKEEKENVGIFSPNKAFFGDKKYRERELNLNFPKKIRLT